MRYFLELAYDGSGFHGWQIQPNASSVQQTLEAALSKLLKTSVAIVGAGRTDTGVNAARMYAHFDTDKPLCDIKDSFLKSLNSMVGKNIAVYDVIPVDDHAHARFDAVRRTYRYFCHLYKSPFIDRFSWQAPPYLDFETMNMAAKLLLDVDDFTSFAKLHTDNKTNICKVVNAGWKRADGSVDRYFFEISADRFLRNMVRAIVGTLVDVGRGKLSVDGFRNIIAEKNRCSAGVSMPPHPLFLWSVEYPYIHKNGAENNRVPF